MIFLDFPNHWQAWKRRTNQSGRGEVEEGETFRKAQLGPFLSQEVLFHIVP